MITHQIRGMPFSDNWRVDCSDVTLACWPTFEGGRSPARASSSCDGEASVLLRQQQHLKMKSLAAKQSAIHSINCNWRLAKLADSEDVENFAKGLEARNPWESVAVECSGYAAGLSLRWKSPLLPRSSQIMVFPSKNGITSRRGRLRLLDIL